MRPVAVSVLIAVLSLSGCGGDGSPVSAVPEGAIVPLAIGNRWLMDDTVWVASGAVLSISVDTFQVLRDTLMAGQAAYVMHWRNIDLVVANKLDGFYENNHPHPSLRLTFKYPAHVGDSASVARYYGATMVVTSTDSLVSSPAGAFHCYVYYTVEYSGSYTYAFRDMISPDIGFIGYDRYRTDGGNTGLRLAERSRLRAFVLR